MSPADTALLLFNLGVSRREISRTLEAIAVELYERGHTQGNIAYQLRVAPQTVRRWVLPGERERHNEVVSRHRERKNPRRMVVPAPERDHLHRIEHHKVRVQQELSALKP